MISIRKYLTDGGTDSTNPLLPVCTLLLEAIIQSSLAYDREEYREFSSNLRNLSAALQAPGTPRELLALAESAAEAMEKYNRGAQNAHAAQTVELRSIIEMLSQTLTALAEAGGQSVQSLQDIRTQLEKARQLDDIRLLKARLGDSLKSISEEARRQRERNAEILHQAEGAAQAALVCRVDPELDRVSGLPPTQKAEFEISARLGPDSQCFAAVFVVERVESINLRYGYAAGDQLLHAFGRYLDGKLTPGDRLFRWRGPTFLVLLERNSSLEAVRAEITRFASSGPEYAMEVDGRTLKLPLGCAWALVPLARCTLIGHAIQQIDRFVAEHWEKRA